MTPADDLTTLEAFVALARAARRRALGREERARLEALDETLRDRLDGARPAPRRIAGAARAAPPADRTAPLPEKTAPPPSEGTAAPPTERKAAPPTERKAAPPTEKKAAPPTKPPEPPPPRVTGAIALARSDATKLRSVELAPVARRSTFTPSRRPPFVDAYYEGAVELDTEPVRGAPRQVVDAEGGRVELPPVTLDLWGVTATAEEDPPMPADPASPSSPSSPASPSSPSPSSRSTPSARSSRSSPTPEPSETIPERDTSRLPPAIVHLRAGGTRRGFIERFDAAGGCLLLVGRDGGEVEVPIAEVLVVFFGRRPDRPPSSRKGTRVEVTLVNDRRLVGWSEDYRPNASAMTVVPDEDRGGVDHVWVPAWSVRAIRVE